MKNTLEERTRVVRRITVDERMAGGLIRILVANLKSDRTIADDDPEYWEEETELYIRPDDFAEKMGLEQANIEKWFRDALWEIDPTHQTKAAKLLPMILRGMGMKLPVIEEKMLELSHEIEREKTGIEEWLPRLLPELDITPTDIKKWLWANLREGQVFLQGAFREVKQGEAEAVFEVAARRRDFQRIDYISKGRTKRIYMDALERSITHGEADQTG